MFIWEHSTRSKPCTLPSQGTPILFENQPLQQMQKEEVESMIRQSFWPRHSSAQPRSWYSGELFCFLFGRCPFLTDGSLHNDDKCEWAAVISAHHLCTMQYRQSNTPLFKRGKKNMFSNHQNQHRKSLLPGIKIARGNSNHHKVVTGKWRKIYPWLFWKLPEWLSVTTLPQAACYLSSTAYQSHRKINA